MKDQTVGSMTFRLESLARENAALKAEIERMRTTLHNAEVTRIINIKANERLKVELRAAHDAWYGRCRVIDERDDEIGKLRAEVQRLRDKSDYEAVEQKREIERLIAALRNIIAGNGGECGCAETARAALEGKP